MDQVHLSGIIVDDAFVFLEPSWRFGISNGRRSKRPQAGAAARNRSKERKPTEGVLANQHTDASCALPAFLESLRDASKVFAIGKKTTAIDQLERAVENACDAQWETYQVLRDCRPVDMQRF